MPRTSSVAKRSLLLAVSLAACEGKISSPAGSAGSPPPPALPSPGVAPPLFTCDPTQVPDELPLPRLSHAQLGGALRAAIHLANPTDADAIWSATSGTFDRFPPDAITPAPGDIKGGFGRTDQQLQQTHVDALYDAAKAIAAQLTASPARMTALLGACATNASSTDDTACLRQFVTGWGARVLRAPLTDDDITFYLGIAGATPVDPNAVADVIATVLQAPEFFYRVEHGTNDAQPVSPLSAYELASRLSLHLWNEPPDDALWSAAQAGALLSAEGYAAQVERLTASPKARDAADELVTQWLRLNELPPFDALNNDPVFRAFAGAQLPTASTRDELVADVLGSFHAMMARGGSLSAFLTDTQSYPASDSPSFSPQGRAGLLTRAALLSTGTATTRPIHKGYQLRNALLCQPIGAPPANVNLTPPAPEAVETTRDVVTRITGTGACSGCHTTIINPAGFVTEGFDALGRPRALEKVFDATGALKTSLPVDTTATLSVLPGDVRTVSDPAALTRLVDESKLYHSCFARRYFRFSQARAEDPVKDGCLLQRLEAAARANGPVTDVFKAAVLAPTFTQRNFQ